MWFVLLWWCVNLFVDLIVGLFADWCLLGLLLVGGLGFWLLVLFCCFFVLYIVLMFEGLLVVVVCGWLVSPLVLIGFGGWLCVWF